MHIMFNYVNNIKKIAGEHAGKTARESKDGGI